MKLLLLLALLLPAIGLPVQKESNGAVWLMFFMKGPEKSPDAATSEKHMQGHFANMKAQAENGRLFAAGPLQDPTQQRRGITVVTAKRRKDVDALFRDDPFVKARIMTVAASEWTVQTSRFEPKVDPSSIGEFRLVLVTRGRGMSPESPEMRRQHEGIMKSFSNEAAAVWGYVTGDQGILEALILEGKDEDAIRTKLKTDPLFLKAILDFEILPLWMSKGIIKVS